MLDPLTADLRPSLESGRILLDDDYVERLRPVAAGVYPSAVDATREFVATCVLGRTADREDSREGIVDALDAEVHSRTRYRNWKNIGHHMGTTRMRENPGNGVVDPQCRTHDLTNLSVASSSVFLTSGALQPTLTVAALALRLADRLEDELR